MQRCHKLWSVSRPNTRLLCKPRPRPPRRSDGTCDRNVTRTDFREAASKLPYCAHVWTPFGVRLHRFQHMQLADTSDSYEKLNVWMLNLDNWTDTHHH